MEEIEVCEDAEEIGGTGRVIEMTGADGHFGLMNTEPSGILQMKTINSLRVLSKDPDIIVVKERQFKCEVQSCGQKFLSSASLLRHKKRCHSDSGPEATLESSAVSKSVSFTCQVCSKVFSQQGNLKAHLRTHSNDLPFACNFSGCRRCFNSGESLKRHKLTHLGIKLFDCDICGRSCSSNLALKEHVARHVNLKPYRCDTCGRMFRQVSCYKRHLQTHNSQHRPFECDICHQAFSQTVYLKSHMKSHTGEKPFECGQCLKRFAHASDRNRHMSVHSDERKFACGLCGSRFTDPSSCRRHIHEHSSAKSNVCMICDASFKRSFQLKHHMAKSHGIEVNTIPTISICQSLPASSFNRSLSPTVRKDGAKIRIVVNHCPSGSVLIGGTKTSAGISRAAQREAQVMMGTSRPEAQVTRKASRPVQRAARATVRTSKPVQRDAQMTMGISRPLVKEAAVGISRHVLETANGVVSLLVYPVHTQAAETNNQFDQEQEFPENQNIICQFENQILSSTNEPDLRVNISEGTESNHAAAISNVISSRSNFGLAVNLAECKNNFTSVENFSEPGCGTEKVCSHLNNSRAPTHSVLTTVNTDTSEEMDFTDNCFSKMTPIASTNLREATESLPLCDTLSPVSGGKNDAMELLTLCHEYPTDQNSGNSTALTSDKGFADMNLPYDDVLKMLSASDSLDQLNCFENLHQDVCR